MAVGVGFEMQDIGTCPAGKKFIESKTECERAANLLGLADTTTGDNSHDTNPYGCYYKKSDDQLYWSLAGGKFDDDKDRVSICSTVAGVLHVKCPVRS